MQTIPFEAAVAKKFGLERAPTLLAQQAAVAPIAFTKLQNEGTLGGRTMAVPPEETFSLLVALTPMAEGEIWVDGKHGKLPAASPGDVFIFNLATSPTVRLSPPYEFMRFYLPVATLDHLAYDRGVRRVGGLRTTSLGIQDPVMHGLARSMQAAVQEPNAAPALFVDSIALAFHAHVARVYGKSLSGGTSAGGGLAPRQLRRANAFMEAHIDGNPSISDLARECRMSSSHFSRSFRQAVGMPPHQWLTKRRIERAKDLLREGGGNQLAQVALACGFADQSHLTRTFKRYEGHAPARWRRLHCG